MTTIEKLEFMEVLLRRLEELQVAALDAALRAAEGELHALVEDAVQLVATIERLNDQPTIARRGAVLQ